MHSVTFAQSPHKDRQNKAMHAEHAIDRFEMEHLSRVPGAGCRYAKKTTMSGISASIQKLKSAAGWYIEPAEHCDVSSIADSLQVTFPKAYHDFLCCAGNGFIPLKGSRYCIEDDLAAMQRSARSIAQKNNLNLPSDAFVFRGHQGYAFNFFLLYDGEDPPVYELVDGIPQFERVSPAFTNWISLLVDEFLSNR